MINIIYKKRFNGTIDRFVNGLFDGNFRRNDETSPYYLDLIQWIEQNGEPTWSELETLQNAKSIKLKEIQDKKNIFITSDVTLGEIVYDSSKESKNSFFQRLTYFNQYTGDFLWKSKVPLAIQTLSSDQIQDLSDAIIIRDKAADTAEVGYTNEVNSASSLDDLSEIIVNYGS